MSAMSPQENRDLSRPTRPGMVSGVGVAADHDLLPAVVQRVESVEELFLRALLGTERLDVVHQ